MAAQKAMKVARKAGGASPAQAAKRPMKAKAKKGASSKGKVLPEEVEKAVAAEVEEVEEADDDEEDEEDQDAGEEAATGAVASKGQKTKANRLKEMEEKEPKEPRGVIYLGHVPTGFYEPQMQTFFAQFGKVTRLRISRSKRNGKPKGYAFVEFEEEAVAQIVADTMHRYLLFEKQLVCHVVPREKQHPALFKGWKRGLKNWTNKRRQQAAAAHNDRPKLKVGDEDVPQATRRQVARRNNKEKKMRSVLEQLEIDFPILDASDGRKHKTFGARKGKKEQPPPVGIVAQPAAAGSKAKAPAAEKPAAAAAAPAAKRRKKAAGAEEAGKPAVAKKRARKA